MTFPRRIKYLKRNFILAIIAFSPLTSHAIPMGYNFEWTGSGGYTMEGMFTGEDLDNDMWIRDTEVVSLMFEGFLNGSSIGMTSGAQALSGGAPGYMFNFNYSLSTNEFGQGNSTTGDGQWWNGRGPSIGFLNGSASAFLTATGANIYASRALNPNTYTVTPKNTVPSPTPLALFGAGIFAIGFQRKLAKKRTILPA